ncbi:MAG: hypothetical protein JOZ80_20470 [Acidobacteriaceae bacterium]|nr:hypothetical protein [Acidobacteriaceae bacterium]
MRLPTCDAGDIVNFTPAFEGSLLTPALIWTVFAGPAWTAVALDDTETVIAKTVMVVDADLEVSATDVALTVIVRLLAGGFAGAV